LRVYFDIAKIENLRYWALVQYAKVRVGGESEANVRLNGELKATGYSSNF